MIDLPRYGNLNLHASLCRSTAERLPFSGQLRKEKLSLALPPCEFDAGLDTGDILMKQELPITADDSARLSRRSCFDRRQPHGGKSTAPSKVVRCAPLRRTIQRRRWRPILTKDDGRVDFERTATEIYNRLRGFQPWPGAHTLFRGRHLQIHGVRPLDQRSAWRPANSGSRLSPSGRLREKHRDGIARASAPKASAACQLAISSMVTSPLRARSWDNKLQMPVSPARAAAFEILLRVERDQSYAAELLHSERNAKAVSGRPMGLLRIG